MEVDQEDNKGEKHPDIQKSRDVVKKIDQRPSNDDGISTLDESPSTGETLMSGIATLPMQRADLQASSPTMLARSSLSTPGSSSSGPATPSMRASPANLALMSPTDVEEEDKWAYLIHKSTEISKYAPSTSTAVTSMCRLDISKSDVHDGENRCKQLEAKIEPLIQKLKGITGYNGTGRYRRRRILERRRSKVKRELAKVWKELIILKQESERNQHKRWSVNEEVENLFNVALKLSYPEFKDEESTVVFSIGEYGEFHCEDVLDIWPRLGKEGRAHLGPRRVGWQIKKNLQLQQPEMIQGEPSVLDIVRNRSFTKKHLKDIDQLKKASELTLGEGEIWEEGVERALVLHLLKFTEVIEKSCYPAVLPHKLCKYLYDLSVRFNSYCDSWEVGIAETKLLLCKATEVVMEKCFQLLGITPESSSLGDKQGTFGLPKSFLQVGRLNHEDPPKKPNPRFQLLSVYIRITRDLTPRECMLFGKITISDTYGIPVALFDCDWVDQIKVPTHLTWLDLGNPSSSHLVPLSSFMEISTELYVTTLTEDALFPLSRRYVEMEFANFWKMEADTKRGVLPLIGMDGHVWMHYVLLKDAMDCAIEVTYDFKEDRKVYAEIYAYFGSGFLDKDPLEKSFFSASLYIGRFDGKVGKVPLKTSMMAVPAKGSIVIEASLYDVDSKEHGYLDGSCTFDAQPRDAFKKEICGSCSCCSLSVRVVWSQGVC
ncbi:arginine--tRNA ligase, cytoplasmic [Artemisia annua]|uniref:arginine--tRNA ligase n=1 Tax=Artemisia annua TaxID=35608 RepID=A0A2U1M1F2_ARTAN|nr:arginine--tRNA ligase, cytoplasmic [Artemisia annua]